MPSPWRLTGVGILVVAGWFGDISHTIRTLSSSRIPILLRSRTCVRWWSPSCLSSSSSSSSSLSTLPFVQAAFTTTTTRPLSFTTQRRTQQLPHVSHCLGVRCVKPRWVSTDSGSVTNRGTILSRLFVTAAVVEGDDLNPASFNTNETNDLDRWEAMYQTGETVAATAAAAAAKSSIMSTTQTARPGPSPIRLVTFDLDNTLWRTGATIDAANQALAEYMARHMQKLSTENASTTTTGTTNSTTPVRVERVMGLLFQANPERYSPVPVSNNTNNNTDGNNPGSAKKGSPVYLTQLRKDAIRYVLNQADHQTAANSTATMTIPGSNDNHNVTTTTDDNTVATKEQLEIVEAAFEVWRMARYASIPLHLAQAVPETLQRIKSMPSPSRDPNKPEKDRPAVSSSIVVGAITDGNSNPMDITALAPYFDFCVNAEQVGVLKPDRRVYLHALRCALDQHESLRNVMVRPGDDDTDDRQDERTIWAELSDDQLEEFVGPWWVHIGDDFVKDVVAAKALNMRSIWARELVLDTTTTTTLLRRSQSSNTTTASAPQQRSVEDLVKRIAGMKVVEMSIGADDYLAESLQDEFADAVVDRFSDIPQILLEWQQEATTLITRDTLNEPSTDRISSTAEESNASDLSNNEAETQATKFCMSCGAKLPVTAKFCFVCGVKQ